jgi:hypothetical protein
VKILTKAHSVIQFSLFDKVLREAVHETIVVGLWKKLESKFKKKSLTNRLYKKQHLYTLQISEKIKVKDHLDNFNRIIIYLHGVGVTIDYGDQAIILLYSLSNSHVNFVDIMLYGMLAM